MSKDIAIEQLKSIQPGEYGYEEAQFVLRFGKSLLDYDCWTHLEEMIGEKISYDAYLYVDHAFGDALIEYEEDYAPDFIRLYERYKNILANGVRLCPICGKTYLDYPALSRVDNQTEICPECGMAEALRDFAERPKEQKRTIYQKLKEMEETERRNDERIKHFLADQQADGENNV